MIHWYTGPGGEYAYSVRPDLWRAGKWVGVKGHGYCLADWVLDPTDCAQKPASWQKAYPDADRPGVAESLILAGQVISQGMTAQFVWVGGAL